MAAPLAARAASAAAATGKPPTCLRISSAARARSARCARPRVAAGPTLVLKSRRKAAKHNLKGGQGCGRHSPPLAARVARAAAAAGKATHMPPHLELSRA